MLALLVLGLVTGGAPSAPAPSAVPSILRRPSMSLRAPAPPLFAPLPNSDQQYFVPRFGLPSTSFHTGFLSP